MVSGAFSLEQNGQGVKLKTHLSPSVEVGLGASGPEGLEHKHCSVLQGILVPLLVPTWYTILT